MESTPRPPIGVRHQSLRDAVAEELRERIIEGVAASGDRLVERDIAGELEVSRVVVREALQQLAMEGLVVVLPRRGATVATFTAQDADHLLDVRGSLETLAARRAAENHTPEDLARLEAVLDAAREAIARRDLSAAAAHNVAFHLEIVRCAHNPVLVATMSPLTSQVRRFFRMGQDSEATGWHDAHEALFEAIAARDADRAAALAADHITRTREPLLDRVDRTDTPTNPQAGPGDRLSIQDVVHARRSP